MQKTYCEELLLRTCHCDMGGAWRPSSVLEAMQESAGMHSHLLGCGRDQLIKRGIVWVLSRCQVRMDAYPGIGERVRILTYPTAVRHWFFPRHFTFTGENGRPLGAAATLWALFDLESRRMAPPGEVAQFLPDNADLRPILPAPGAIERCAGEAERFERACVFSELDVNGHLNNTRYADWLCDALGLATMRANCLCDWRINYAAEVLPGQEVSLRLTREGQKCYLCGEHAGKAHFEISARLAPR